MNIAITGHRPNKLGNEYNLRGPLTTKIRNHLQNHIIEPLLKIIEANPLLAKPTFVSGMALGIDTIWAELAILNKLPYIAAIPFKGQERMWVHPAKIKYYDLLKQAESISVVDIGKAVTFEQYNELPDTIFKNEKMQRRNEYMVDISELLVGVWDGTNGGTNNCLNYALKVKRHTLVVKIPEFKILEYNVPYNSNSFLSLNTVP